MVYIWVWEPESLGPTNNETRADILVYRAAAHRAGSTTAYAEVTSSHVPHFLSAHYGLRAVMLYPVTGRVTSYFPHLW